VLVTPGPAQVYSGMVPGVIAGHYALADAQIDLARLAERAGARLVPDRALSLEAAAGRVTLEKSGVQAYDLLSIDIGSLPDRRVPGSEAHAVLMKPFDVAVQRLAGLKAAGRAAVVGAGAAGVEIAMALRHASPRTAVTLYSDRPMFSGRLRERVAAALERNDVRVRKDLKVEAVEPGPRILAGGASEAFDLVLWTAGSAPHPWLAESGLERDERGFVLVERSLRSVSHPQVFASGDCATLRDAPHPKSGVYAVRHAPVLAENLRRSIGGGELVRYEPQGKSLVLLSCGGRYAIAARGGWSAEGAWVWRWKDWIDRRFVKSFG
jgi:selenide,water dikinase